MIKEDKTIWVTDDVCYCKEAHAILMTPDTASVFMDEKNLMPERIGDYLVAPWGVDNLLPQRVMDKIEKVEIVGANADFNWRICYGMGPRLVKNVYSDDPREQVWENGVMIGAKVVDQIELFGGEMYEWLERNKIGLYLQEVLTDLSYFHNSFPMLIPEKDSKKIYSLIHREAMFSRWQVDERENIIGHLYSSKWDENPGNGNIERSYVIDETDDIVDINSHILGTKREPRLVYPLFMPSPGRPMYSYPNWYSIFRSGWFDHLGSIPNLKKAILKHNLGVKHIIYVSPAFFQDKARQLGVDESDQKAINEMKQKLIDEINEHLTGEENAGKALAALEKIVPSGNGTTTEKYFHIEKIDNGISGGEYLTDYESGANIICYAMNTHPSLIGAVPGKNSNSLSGSNQREIYMIKQLMSTAMLDCALRPLSAIRRINGWDMSYRLIVPAYDFTTLDQNKSGKQEIEKANVS